MLTSEEALAINKAMKVDPTSKTPYSDATQVRLNILFLPFVSLLHDVSLFNFGRREVSRWKAVIISRVILVAKLPVRRSFPSPHDMHSNYLEAHKHINEGC